MRHRIRLRVDSRHPVEVPHSRCKLLFALAIQIIASLAFLLGTLVLRTQRHEGVSAVGIRMHPHYSLDDGVWVHHRSMVAPTHARKKPGVETENRFQSGALGNSQPLARVRCNRRGGLCGGDTRHEPKGPLPLPLPPHHWANRTRSCPCPRRRIPPRVCALLANLRSRPTERATFRAGQRCGGRTRRHLVGWRSGAPQEAPAVQRPPPLSSRHRRIARHRQHPPRLQSHHRPSSTARRRAVSSRCAWSHPHNGQLMVGSGAQCSVQSSRGAARAHVRNIEYWQGRGGWRRRGHARRNGA